MFNFVIDVFVESMLFYEEQNKLQKEGPSFTITNQDIINYEAFGAVLRDTVQR
jgi:hypothetical protein